MHGMHFWLTDSAFDGRAKKLKRMFNKQQQPFKWLANRSLWHMSILQ